MTKLPLWMRAANWLRVHIFRKSTVYGIIRYTTDSRGFTPKFETMCSEHRGGSRNRAAEWIAKMPREPQ